MPAGEPGLAGDLIEPHQVGARRAPRIARFIVIGALIGVLLGIGLTFLGRGTTYQLAIAIFLAVGLGCLGALLGAVGALLADRRSVGRPGAPAKPDVSNLSSDST